MAILFLLFYAWFVCLFDYTPAVVWAAIFDILLKYHFFNHAVLRWIGGPKHGLGVEEAAAS